ncbi:MerR family transcriptional regulator [Veronia pacifica]|uniref:MerR family transcriptional regulator n=2 Tax=Veronia pacifica TaxID=1080227 RepID=A0A1C3EG04_9GAMM|nr:MerR family transcriptional regulator [Veronia pacifica]
MFIGKLSKKVGISIKAIRYYEEIGLIKPAQREGKYRVYDDSYIPVLEIIKLAKKLGFTLDELKEIAESKSQQGLVPITQLRQALGKKRANVMQQIEALNQVLSDMTTLEEQVTQYNQCLLSNLASLEPMN